MAGRGRGRGRGMSFNIESLGLGRGESIPGSIQQPPPLFPTLDYKPAPLLSGEEFDYLVALKQEFRSTMRDSSYFIKPCEKKRDVARYSDKYTINHQDNNSKRKPDWTRLPSELEIKKKVFKNLSKPNINKPRPRISGINTEKKLEELEEQEKNTADQDDEEEEEEDEAEKDEEGGEGGDEVEDEEDLEDDTDYNMTYFDNGENFGADEDDDLDEGPVY